MTVADVTSSIQAIEQRIATISPSAAQVFATPSTTGAATPASFATQLQTAGVDQTGTDDGTLPDLLPTTTAPDDDRPADDERAPASTNTQYDSLIQQAARDQGVDPALLKGLVQAESGFNPNSVSSVGAQGLTQLMPDTARGLGVTNSFDPLQNLEGGARFLAGALKRFGGNEQLALAAYNAGPGAVERYGGIPPYAETQAYVPRVLGYANEYRAQGFGQTPAITTTTPGVASPVAAPERRRAHQPPSQARRARPPSTRSRSPRSTSARRTTSAARARRRASTAPGSRSTPTASPASRCPASPRTSTRSASPSTAPRCSRATSSSSRTRPATSTTRACTSATTSSSRRRTPATW